MPLQIVFCQQWSYHNDYSWELCLLLKYTYYSQIILGIICQSQDMPPPLALGLFDDPLSVHQLVPDEGGSVAQEAIAPAR